ncbi:uncharacterized protein LOC130694083 [Daphnia carinata]|uniref:uncharacterized protein LOC130694083 n=1 Tax=Daphnia carinata TaxID=120202 RepID=UPI00257F15A3|nr:uncharacterized protein LOC130694083 [Daphnia carinata]XP_057373236.1 uncharacterized protein LOC130694083 [Daphnia carinata]
MGSSTSSIPESRSTGAAYTKKLYFDPNADSPEGYDYSITDAELRETLSELVDVTERIVEVRYYKHPLSSMQLTDGILHHAFIVFETNAWWWSIEKNDEGVTMQRSTDFDSVCEKYRRSDRQTSIGNGVEMVKKASGSTTVMELIDHLWEGDYLNQEYNFETYNCQHFADLIYEFI